MTEEVRKWWHRWTHPTGIHPWRWRALTLWIILFTIMVLLALRQNSNQSAGLGSLQKTNCGIKVFLLTAREARLDSADNNFGLEHQNDLRAAQGYKVLADRFTAVGRCHIPMELQVHTKAKQRR